MSTRTAAGWPARLLVVLLVPVALAVTVLTVRPTEAQALSGADFRAGNIIADSVFLNEHTMSAANIQSFLDAKNTYCAAGYTCLKNYHQDTPTRGADAQCATYAGVANERASTIINKVAKACGVNPMVLLVLLQKETSLVTKSNPTWDNAYKKATGYGCPDTAPCDAQYYGFFNQVYKAAWQFKRYINNPTSYAYQAGRTKYIQWNPDAGCGGANVYIETKATAALYIYTPYQPNSAALNNLYGTGDRCSAYGNRNFWRMFTDWFGSTQVSYSVLGPISGAYDVHGGSSGVLGDAVGNQYPTPEGGVTQAFENGRIHWSPATGAHAVIAPLSGAYDANGGESGWLGYPTGGRYGTSGNGWTQSFQKGRIHWSPTTGAHAVISEISGAYDRVGGEGGILGYPTGGRYATKNYGWTQAFQRGRIHWSPTTGAHVVHGVVQPVYDGLGGESGVLGYPVGGQYAAAGNGLVQAFQNGRVHSSPTTGTHAVLGPLSVAYDALRGESGPLGYPTGGRYATKDDGWTQTFQNGRIHYSPATGAHAVIKPLSPAYDALAGESGALGYPVAAQYPTTAEGLAQAFQRGTVVVSSSGTVRTVQDAIGTTYASLDGAAGVLGEPTGALTQASGGGSMQTFQHGRIVDGPDTAAIALLEPVLAAYDALGGPQGPLGWPTSAQSRTASGSTVQSFEDGDVVVTSSGARTVLGAIRAEWTGLDGVGGVLGEPTADRVATSTTGGWMQTFTGGVVISTPTTGTHAVAGPLGATYLATGGETGSLGLPVADRYATTGGGWTQAFQNGRIHYSPATGAHAVLKPIAAAYDALRGESGDLGYPVGGRYATSGNGWTQAFQNGRIHYSPATGAHAVLKPIAAAYDAQRGESGPLGYPVGARYATTGSGWTQAFQNGRIHYSAGTGAHAVLKPIAPAYDALRGESGPLGYPVGARYATAGGGWTQAFQNGRIHYSPATGAQAVLAPISATYDSVRGESGRLGYPTGPQRVTGSGVVEQDFQHGMISAAPGQAPKVFYR